MFLKGAEIFGFKTFAERTIFEFGPQITVIAGPNGSGKSNICDSILWVLGEQSLKALRVNKLEEVIFRGNRRRKSLGLAEVSLLLDNSNSDFPINYSEVCLTRRMFRSGESEFLLNKNPCKLKDIQEFLLDSGVGKNGFSVINQGDVESILDWRSDNRRALIEEAAKISRYKFHKREALRKLENTARNLVRIDDVLNEVKSQLVGLSEQAKKAKEYKGYAARLNELELNLLLYDYRHLLAVVENLWSRKEGLSQQIQRVNNRVAGLNEVIQALKSGLIGMEGKLDERGQEFEFTKNEIKALEGQIDVDLERAKGVGSRKISLQKEIENLDTKLVILAGGILETKEQEQVLVRLIKEQTKTLQGMEVSLKVIDADLESLAQSINRHNEDYVELAKEVAGNCNEAHNAEYIIENMENQLPKLDSKIEGLNKQYEQTSQRCAQLDEEIAHMRRKINDIKAGLSAYRGQQRQEEDGLKEKLEEVEKLKQLINDSQAKLKALMEIEASLGVYSKGVRAVLSSGLAGNYQVLANILEIPPEYLWAVEAALGDNLQIIISETREQAKKAVEFLKSHRAGRATFLPLDSVNSQAIPQILPEAGIIGLAADLVKFDSRYQPVVNHLLGKVIVVRDLDVAWGLAGNLRLGFKVVTLDGELVDSNGIIAGGGGEDSVLVRRKEIKWLRGKLSEWEDKLIKINKLIAEKQVQIKVLGSKISDLVGQILDGERVVADKIKDLEYLKMELKRLAGELEEAGFQRLLLLDELGGVQKKASEVAKIVKALEDKQNELDDILQKLGGELKEKELKRKEIEGALTQLHVERASLDARLNSLRETGVTLEKSKADILAEIGLKRGELGGLVQGQKELEGTIKGRRDCLSELIRKFSILEKSLDELKSEYHLKRNQCDNKVQELENLKGVVHQLEDKLHQLDLRLIRAEEQLQYGERRLVEEFKLEPERALGYYKALSNKGQALKEIGDLKLLIDGMGVVNLGAIEEYEKVRERYENLVMQRDDLAVAKEKLGGVIKGFDVEVKRRFLDCVERVSVEFEEIFRQLFGKGTAELVLTDMDDVLERDIEIKVNLPGKKEQGLHSLSAGERTLTALAFLFAILRIKPHAFCVLDEVDATLDDYNVQKFTKLLREFSKDTQFVVITHNKGTMEAADVIYGVTMEEPAVSKLISLRLEDVE